MRKAAQITGAALIAAVLMTGCSSGSDDKDGKKADAKPEQSAGRSAAPGQDGEGAKGDGSEDKLISSPGGAYLAQSAEGPVALTIVAGQAALASDGGKRTCSGTVSGKSLTLTCSDGGDKRTRGLIEKSDATSMVVFWEGGPKETFARQSGGAKLPGLPKLGG
ncbi:MULTISPECIES: hypothetical protein [Streptomyces]|uniref:hypothetical protein n=1 Tax=Streptomyces TaxID=1883 RepID=UPI00163C9F94|nr:MULTISPECIES: hypothetical protein [Streptomyces]MBC2878763.1 hypothetical protein [Streptomyces sp. TYQ1024]UBI39316.1 hypothetical protein K7I03_24555 [Streptomyces mobaraensis]UKW31896.1 hypothetical protein MCU78_24490 [Streptomyces sp. TYQ1024]